MEVAPIVHKSQDIKKYANLYIAKAAAKIIERSFPYESTVEREMLPQYEAEVREAEQNNLLPPGVTLAVLKRRKNFEKKEVKEGDLHTSHSLWRKWGEIKITIVKHFTPKYNSVVAYGVPPTAEDIQKVLSLVRDEEANSSENKETRKQCMSTGWTPPEWLAFLKLGPPAGSRCLEIFRVKRRGRKRKTAEDEGQFDGPGFPIFPTATKTNVKVPPAPFSDIASPLPLLPDGKMKAAKLLPISAVKPASANKFPMNVGRGMQSPPSSSSSSSSSLALVPGMIPESEKSKVPRKMSVDELAVYKFNVALQARKDRIEELKDLVAIEDNASEKKKIKAALKALLLTPPPSEEDYKRQAVLELAGADDTDLVSFV